MDNTEVAKKIVDAILDVGYNVMYDKGEVYEIYEENGVDEEDEERHDEIGEKVRHIIKHLENTLEDYND